MGKILELSKRSSKLACEAFNSATYKKLWSRFPTNIIQKLVKVPGDDPARMEGILAKIVQLRQQAQLLDDECGGSTATATEKKAPSKVTAEVFFRSAQRYEECRICVHLSATSSSHQGLFEGHLSNYATGCPKFMEATSEMRRNLVMKVKLCIQCLHPDIIFNQAHKKECLFNNKKNKYTCTSENCREHMWVCLTHKQRNRSAMDRFRQDMLSKGLTLAMTCYVPLQACSAEAENAVRKIRRGQQKRGKDIVPVPEGEPLFLFHPTQGKTRPVNTFYDTGCSHAVFKEGVPGGQLRGQLVAKGPFDIGGVGGLTARANDEWVVGVKRMDGRTQLVQGLTVETVTAEFPTLNLTAAVADVKAADSSNQLLQRCQVPQLAGGSVDMLLGSKYLSIFPKEVHSLPSGLTIYQSQLASHGGEFDSCIGGPHSSFTVLAGLAGGTSQLLACFIDSLQVYRQSGPPRITSIALTEDEVKLAMEYNATEMVESHILSSAHELDDVEAVESVVNEEYEEDVTCSYCFNNFTVGSAVAHDERVAELKKFKDMNEAGLEIEYRCPKCRQCVDCKSADKTEKVSLREESEMYEVRNSVKLDLQNQRIQCSLPLRGKERDYLSNNKDRAMKILQQQCRKYFQDSNTRDTILAAFAKLFENGHAKLLSDLTQEQLDKFMGKEVQHHIPWRVVFSPSPTTPCRPVMDASTRTAFRTDGSGGRCLNDLVCKGKIETLNLVKVLLRFITGKVALAGDLQQFYNACKLNPDMWNLQRFLWMETLDPEGEVLEAVMTTLIYGVKCVSAQSEFALSELAELVKEEFPELALFLVVSRYVDDLLDSKNGLEDCLSLTKVADEVFSRVGLVCKSWTYSTLPPSPKVSKDGLSIGVGGFAWYPEGDILELKVARLHFGKPKRGKISESVRFFDETEQTMDEFVPSKLSRRQVASKLASQCWDILGKLAPLMTGLKLDLREVFKSTQGWDDPMPPELRAKWVQNFLLIEKCRGLRYTRAIMPLDAVDTNMRLLTGVDAAKEGLMMGSWGGFKTKDGSWSNQLVLGRSLLARSESIPKDELEALCGGSNMAWVVRMALKEWVKTSILFGDSRIALCWLTSEKLRLSLYHRNRVLQIRRGTELDSVYHVMTEFNPADSGTRPSKVKLSDIGPDSRWENGDSWMRMDISQSVAQGILLPAADLRITQDEEPDFNQGLVFGDKDEILTRGHVSSQASKNRIQKVKEIAKFSEYLISPTKFPFPKTVRIYGYVLLFITKTRRGKATVGALLGEAKFWFSTFHCNLSSKQVVTVCVQAGSKEIKDNYTQVLKFFAIKQLGFESNSQQECSLTDRCLHLALLYLYRKGANEVKNFVNKKLLDKIAYEVDGILLSKGRLIDGMNFVETGEFENFNIESLGVKVNIPVLARYSPLSYSIAQYVHWEISRHRGIETTNRLSLQHVSIIQGMNLYRELAGECIRCHMRRKKYMEVPMGPVASEQLVIAPPFYITMVDLFGPLRSFVPGFERVTRSRRELETKVHILVGVCVTTRIVNMQALEGKTSEAIIDGFTRMSSEVGIPTKVLVDQDSGAMAAFKSAELNFSDLQHQLHTQFGINFTTCPVGGHNQHGLVEAIIKSVQETFDQCGLKTRRIHALGWQTFSKLAENAFNNLPLGFSYGRQQDNTELLKIITPNMLRVGRINSRALQGPVRLAGDNKELLKIVDSTYQGWFNIFKETVVPRLINQPKWFRKEVDLKEQDLVYFQKQESDLASDWTIGQVDQVITGRDGLIRRAWIKYYNTGEKNPRLTDRSVRRLVKLWSIDESSLAEDLAEVDRRLGKEIEGTADDGDPHGQVDQPDGVPLVLPGIHGHYQGNMSLIGYYTNICSGDSPVKKADSALSLPCDVSGLLVRTEDLQHGVDEQEVLQAVDESSLHSILTSTGFLLGTSGRAMQTGD